MPRKDFPWQLPAKIENRLSQDSYGPQRAIYEEEHLLLILHEPPSTEEFKREHILFLRTPDGEFFCNGEANGKERLRKLLSDYRSLWERCESDYLEANTAEKLFSVIEKVTPINRSSTNMQNALQSAREAVREERFLIGMRDQATEISRAFDLLFSDTRNTLDFRLAKNAEEQSERSKEMAAAQHKLNVLAAFTFPVLALGTLFGMNLSSGFEKRTPTIFWITLLTGIGVGFFVKKWVLDTERKKKKRP